MLLDGRMSVKDFIGYLVAQFAGGIVGAAVIGCLAGWNCGFGANALYQGDVDRSLLIELILTFVFVLAVLGVTSKIENSHVAGLVIGPSRLPPSTLYIFSAYISPARP
jgi:aquaporin Z